MAKACVVLLPDFDTHEAMGGMANSLTSAKEFIEAGDEAAVVFHGAGTRWVPELEADEHRYHRDYTELQEHIAGACSYRAHVRRQGQDRAQRREAAQRLSRSPGCTRSSPTATRC